MRFQTATNNSVANCASSEALPPIVGVTVIVNMADRRASVAILRFTTVRLLRRQGLHLPRNCMALNCEASLSSTHTRRVIPAACRHHGAARIDTRWSPA
jgi:hypothetical protein